MRNFPFSSKIAVMVIGLAASNFAHSQITNSIMLKSACETSPGNIVNVSQSIKISEPNYPFATTQINSPCTIVITNEQKVEFERANIQFTGALSIQSAGKGEMVSVNSSIKASSFAVNLGGEGSQIASSQSLFQATAGNLTMTLGRQAKMELYSSITRNAVAGMLASGAINISAGERFTGSIADMGVTGNAGVGINISGFEGLLKLEKVYFTANAGSIGINATGSKSLLEAKECAFTMQNKTDIILSGSETGIKLNEIGFYGPTTLLSSIGGVAITAGSAANGFGKVEMGDIKTGAQPLGGGSAVKGSVGSQSGGVKMEKSNISAKGAILFETGGLGTTEVKENRLTSLTSITVRTASDGNCVSSPNFTMQAPVVNACTPAVSLLRLSVYPNPSSDGTLNIEIVEPEVQKDAKRLKDEKDVLLINNRNGQVKSWKVDNSSDAVKTDGLSTGSYTIQVIDNRTGQKTTAKFMVGLN